jgi:hypothetical protein
MSCRRVGIHKVRWEATAQILGVSVYIGSYEFRRQALDAEQVALTIRKTLDRAMAVKRHKEKSSKQIEFTIETKSEEAA